MAVVAVDDELVALLVDGARYGDMEDVDAAFSQHVPVDSKDGAGRTALHMACANGHVEVIQKLLDAGAATTVQNEQGNTPLHWACLNGHIEAVRLLLDNGASAAVLNQSSRTPVDEALTRGHQGIFDLINSYNTGGSVAVEGGDIDEDDDGGGDGGAAGGAAEGDRDVDGDEAMGDAPDGAAHANGN